MSKDSGHYPPLSYQTLVDSRPPANSVTTPTSPYSEQPPSAGMATLPPPPPHMQSNPYQPHANYSMYPPHAQAPMGYPPPQHPPPAANSSQPPPNYNSQPAPRQRTAIACRYCRRRKIRCHGFDSSPDGRCTNCLRFHQECIFTPVSAQAHAFVPAHTAYPYMRNARITTGPDGRPLSYSGPPLYGAHGQPLGPVGHHDPGYPPQPPYAPGPYPAQSPVSQHPPQSQPPLQYDERGIPPQDHRAPPAQRRGSYDYPESSHLPPTSPATTTPAYQSPIYAPPGAQPYYATPGGDRRTSPTTSYFGPRSTGSPHQSNATVLPPLPAGLHPPQVLPAIDVNRNSSPNASTPRNGALSVSDMLTPTSATRSTTDSDMLNALNRRRK